VGEVRAQLRPAEYSKIIAIDITIESVDAMNTVTCCNIHTRQPKKKNTNLTNAPDQPIKQPPQPHPQPQEKATYFL
jgi:hypothetical protein